LLIIHIRIEASEQPPIINRPSVSSERIAGTDDEEDGGAGDNERDEEELSSEHAANSFPLQSKQRRFPSSVQAINLFAVKAG
jgi:hypothetical protein